MHIQKRVYSVISKTNYSLLNPLKMQGLYTDHLLMKWSAEMSVNNATLKMGWIFDTEQLHTF